MKIVEEEFKQPLHRKYIKKPFCFVATKAYFCKKKEEINEEHVFELVNYIKGKIQLLTSASDRLL